MQKELKKALFLPMQITIERRMIRGGNMVFNLVAGSNAAEYDGSCGYLQYDLEEMSWSDISTISKAGFQNLIYNPKSGVRMGNGSLIPLHGRRLFIFDCLKNDGRRE